MMLLISRLFVILSTFAFAVEWQIADAAKTYTNPILDAVGADPFVEGFSPCFQRLTCLLDGSFVMIRTIVS
jgi:hypothetical protein